MFSVLYLAVLGETATLSCCGGTQKAPTHLAGCAAVTSLRSVIAFGSEFGSLQVGAVLFISFHYVQLIFNGQPQVLRTTAKQSYRLHFCLAFAPAARHSPLRARSSGRAG